MSTKRYLTFIFVPLLAALAAAAIVALVGPSFSGCGWSSGFSRQRPPSAEGGTPNRQPAEAGTPALPAEAGSPALPAEGGTASAEVTLAAQKARLTLNDGRTATFAIACSAGTLTAHAAVGLDQECNYALLPLSDPLPPAPSPSPAPLPAPGPAPGPAPDPQPAPKPRPSNLRVLFTYDPAALADLAPSRQAILASAELRNYLDKHCPLESNCSNGMCPIGAKQAASYRFLPALAEVATLPAVWQGIFQAARGKPAPWLLVVNEAGQTVADQPWPDSVEATLALLKQLGGE